MGLKSPGICGVQESQDLWSHEGQGSLGYGAMAFKGVSLGPRHHQIHRAVGVTGLRASSLESPSISLCLSVRLWSVCRTAWATVSLDFRNCCSTSAAWGNRGERG